MEVTCSFLCPLYRDSSIETSSSHCLVDCTKLVLNVRVQFHIAYMKCMDYAVFLLGLDLSSETPFIGEGLHSHDVSRCDFLLIRMS